MPGKIIRLLIASNIYIKDIDEREKFKEKIYRYLEQNEPELLYEIILGK